MPTDVRVQRKKVLVIKQILLVSTLGNVWRIHILMLGREGLIEGNQSELPTRPNETNTNTCNISNHRDQIRAEKRFFKMCVLLFSYI